jgi:hypothetical protein
VNVNSANSTKLARKPAWTKPGRPLPDITLSRGSDRTSKARLNTKRDAAALSLA